MTDRQNILAAAVGQPLILYEFADIPHIAAAGLIENPINPFTGRELPVRKTNDAIITTAKIPGLQNQNKNTFKINKNEWLYVQDNIFDPANWSFITIED